MRLRISLAIASLVVFSSCDFFVGKHIRGSGNVISQPRTVDHFSGLHVSGAIDVFVKQDAAFNVRVETDDNLQQYILVGVDNGVLRIKTEDNISLDETGKIKVYVSAPAFNSLQASGACQLFTENMVSSDQPVEVHLSGSCDAKLELKTPKLYSKMTGASTLMAKGEAKEFEVEGSGSSNIRCFDLVTDRTKLDISGACDAEVFANVNVTVEASGSSDVRYKGNGTATQHISGAGSVKKVD